MPRWRERVSISNVLSAVFAANGFLNLVTGFLPILGVGPRVAVGQVPGYLRVTPSQQISGVVSILLGVVMIALGRGLYQRRRAAWRWAVVLLVALAANNLMRGTTPETGILSGLILIGLLAGRRRFNVPSASPLGYGQVIALASVAFALAYGIVGTHLMRNQFRGLETWTDSIYYTFVTYSTLGYGDILPTTPDARLFVVSMIVVGLGSFITAITMVVGPMIERRMKGVLEVMGRLQRAEDHVIVCGYSSVGESAVDELQERGVPYVIIDDREDLAAHLRSKGHDALTGDAARRETLEQANARGARAVIAASDSDSVNTLVALTARELRDATPGASFRIVARVEDEENIEKMRHIGADEVISPSTMGGRAMAQKALEAGTAPK